MELYTDKIQEASFSMYDTALWEGTERKTDTVKI